jgi:hypothetical protein
MECTIEKTSADKRWGEKVEVKMRNAKCGMQNEYRKDQARFRFSFVVDLSFCILLSSFSQQFNQPQNEISEFTCPHSN